MATPMQGTPMPMMMPTHMPMTAHPAMYAQSNEESSIIPTLMICIACLTFIAIIGYGYYKYSMEQKKMEEDEDGNVELTLDDLDNLDIEAAIAKIEAVEAEFAEEQPEEAEAEAEEA